MQIKHQKGIKNKVIFFKNLEGAFEVDILLNKEFLIVQFCSHIN